jgi:hypothetical protein
VVVFVELAWTIRDDPEPLSAVVYMVSVRASVQPHLPSIFTL